MQQIIQEFRAELRGVWRYRWTAMIVAWVICVLGWFMVFSMPDVYEAQAQVFVDADSRLVEVMGQVGVAPGVGASVFVVRQAMLGRPQLETVARTTGLDQRAKTEEAHDKLILNLQDNIVIASGRVQQAKNLYTISFTNSDREMAVNVVTALLDTFVTDVLALNSKGSVQATDYLQEQLDYYSGLLAEAEQLLADFKKDNIGLLPGAGGGIFERLQQEMDSLKDLRSSLGIELDRREELRAQIQSENPYSPDGATSAGLTSITGSPTENSIRDLEAIRSNLLLSYTDQHPDVIAVGEQLAQLYAKQQVELQAFAQAGGIEGAPNATNPVYQSVQIALNESSVLIAAMRSQVSQLEEDVQRLNGQINTIPDVEAKFARLNRSYNQYKILYNEIVIQKERERMGDAGGEREVVNFNIIEPPTAALEPVAPKRVIFLVLVLMFGLGAGAGAAFLRHLSTPIFTDVRTLRKITGRPILGEVSMTWTEDFQAARKMQLASFSAVVATLLIVFANTVAFEDIGVEAVRSILSSEHDESMIAKEVE